MGQQQKFLGEFEQMAMLAIMQLGDNAYGASIRKRLLDAVGRDVKVGALYVTLDRLESKGLVRSTLSDSDSDNQTKGRTKRFFAVTADGKQALSRAKEAMAVLWKPVEI